MTMQRAIAVLILTGASATAAAQECSHHLMVSGYFSNNVAVFDACSGVFLRQLDTASRISGAQAVRYNPADDLVYVVSEGNDQILRYRRNSGYEFVDVFSQLPANIDPTGIAFGLDDEVYVASYRTSSVLELDAQSGQQIGVVLPSNSGLLGADNGMMVSVLGLLYVPGYDSSSVAMINPESGAVRANFVSSGAGGLVNARGILDEGPTILVGGEGSGAVYRIDTGSGQVLETLITGLSRPTGMARDQDGNLLVLAGNRVRRYNIQTGEFLGVLANPADGGISGGTFLALVRNPDAPTIDFEQLGTQYWIFGSGIAQNLSLNAELVSATGGVFGPNFDPDSVQRKRWGSLSMEFTDCDRAIFSYDSTGPDSANFGSLSYSVVRLVDSDATLQCRAAGFGQVSGQSWMSGAWYGIDRSGEGLVLEVAADGTAVASFYTHLPEGY